MYLGPFYPRLTPWFTLYRKYQTCSRLDARIFLFGDCWMHLLPYHSCTGVLRYGWVLSALVWIDLTRMTILGAVTHAIVYHDLNLRITHRTECKGNGATPFTVLHHHGARATFANLLSTSDYKIQRLAIHLARRSGSVGKASGSGTIRIRGKITIDDPRKGIVIISLGISGTRPFV